MHKVSLIAVCFLYACVAVHNSEVDLYKEYLTYVGMLKNHDFDGATKMLSARYRNLMQENALRIEEDSVSTLDHKIEKEIAVFQQVEDDTGCLTFNGFNSKEEPLTMSLRFKHEKNGWKIDFPYLMFWDDVDEFPDEADCPTPYFEVES